MALLAVTTVSWEGHFVEIDGLIAESINRKIISQIFTRMDLVDHGLEVDGFGGKLIGRPPSLVIRVGVMADHAVLHVLPNCPVQRQRAMTAIAVFLRDHHPPGHCRLIGHCERDHLVETYISNVLDLLGGARL